jgi:hypothetical protein
MLDILNPENLMFMLKGAGFSLLLAFYSANGQQTADVNAGQQQNHCQEHRQATLAHHSKLFHS